jgi:hypothetical protein
MRSNRLRICLWAHLGYNSTNYETK